MPDKENPLAVLVRKAQGIGPPKSQQERAKEVMQEHPMGAEALKGTHVIDSTLLTYLNRFPPDWHDGESWGAWKEPWGRPFAIPPLRTIVLDPNDPNYRESMAHELGHIAQYRNSLPMKNDRASDEVLNRLRDVFKMRENLIPKPAESIDPEIASNLMEIDRLRALKGQKGPSPQTLEDMLVDRFAQGNK
jgi:hypothetical protein